MFEIIAEAIRDYINRKLPLSKQVDAEFDLYEDEGDSYNYERGAYSVIPLKWDDNKKILTIGRRKGKFPGMIKARRLKVVLVRSGRGAGIKETKASDRSVKYTGREIRIKL